MGISIRLALIGDFAATESIELRGDELLVEYLGATNCPAPPSAEERSTAPGFTLIAAEATSGDYVGFAQVVEAPVGVHLEQISVLPEYGRRGFGGLLVEASAEEARRRGHAVMTLRTFADVPWNAPFYAGHGFVSIQRSGWDWRHTDAGSK